MLHQSSSLHLHSSCELRPVDCCSKHSFSSTPELTAVAQVKFRRSCGDDQTVDLTKFMGVYATGFVFFADDRQELESARQRDLVMSGLSLIHTCFSKLVGENGLDCWLALHDVDSLSPTTPIELSDELSRDIVYSAILGAAAFAHATRSPQLFYAATVFRGLAHLHPVFIAVLNDCSMVLSSDAKVLTNPKKFGETTMDLADWVVTAMARNHLGMTMRPARRLEERSDIWFTSQVERDDFLAVVEHLLVTKKEQCDRSRLFAENELMPDQFMSDKTKSTITTEISKNVTVKDSSLISQDVPISQTEVVT